MTLDARDVFRAFAGAGRALFAILARVATAIFFHALAFAANTFAFARANFSTSWRNASVDGIAARAIIASPSWLANAFAALASAVISSGARKTVVVIARKVVTLAELAADNLSWVGARVALAYAANASSSVITKDIGRVVRPAVGFKVAEHRCVGIALAITS